MTNRQWDLDIKVGIFVTLGAGLVLAAILILGSTQSLLTRKNHFTTHFQAVDGLIEGAKVTIGGVSVGVVEHIGFDAEHRNIKVQYSVTKDASIWVREDSMLEIVTQGVLGDKYVSITSGSPDKGQVADGAEIPFRVGKDLTQFLSKGDQLMVSLGSAVATLDRILKNFESGGRSDAFFAGMASTAKNLAAVSDKLNRETLGSVSNILEKIDNGTGTVGALINDPSLYDDLKSLLGGANKNRIVRNLVRESVRNAGANKDKDAPAAADPK